MNRPSVDDLADLVAWAIVALLAWRVYRASRLDSWRDGFRAGFNAAPIGARRAQQEVSP